ncbi:MAG TPA: DUF917 domain-containing protein [Thermomicrobiales bacterium]|nr:DUF917 domain-containing protein [Thermomicrobiales bacterium]
MRDISIGDLDDLAMGAAVLGTGGGGDPYIGKLLARSAMLGKPPVSLMDPADLADDDIVLPTAMMGAPTVMVEKIPSGEEIITAIESLSAFLGKKVTATMPMEAGGVNSMIPFAVAAKLGIPVVDADGMGRAFPELQMVTPTIWGIQASPMAIADDKGNSAILQTVDNRWTETFARSLTVDMGASALISLYPMTGKQVKNATIHRTVSLIERIGRAIRESHERHTDPVGAVCDVMGGFRIWEGKVGDVARRTVGGFARGTASIVGSADYRGRTLEVDFQNEFLVARDGDDVLVTTPDLIAMLDAETGEPITTESLRYGFRVVVIGAPSDQRWRTERGLELVGPSYFGYDLPFVPIESRFG